MATLTFAPNCTYETVPDLLPHGEDGSSNGDLPSDADGSSEDTGLTADTPGSSDVDLVDALLDLTEHCSPVSNHLYAMDHDGDPEVPVCRLEDALFWRADMDVGCDGKPSEACNKETDPWFSPDTTAKDSNGDSLDASKLPFVVLPYPSERFDYRDHDIYLGSVVAVIHDGMLEFGAFADRGSEEVIGEASYAMVARFGVDPDPRYGGIEDGVTYVIFSGSSGVVHDIENHDAAAAIGSERARQLVERRKMLHRDYR